MPNTQTATDLSITIESGGFPVRCECIVRTPTEITWHSEGRFTITGRPDITRGTVYEGVFSDKEFKQPSYPAIADGHRAQIIFEALEAVYRAASHIDW